MSKKKVEIICIMDRSDSMNEIIQEAVGAFNAFINDQKDLPGKARVTLAVFGDQYDVVFSRVKLDEMPELQVGQVRPRGMTALYDAIGKTIRSAKDTENTVVLIQTDGMENASKEYSADDIKSMVEAKQEQGWEFMLIGAGLDNIVEQSQQMGLQTNSVQVNANAGGMSVYEDAMRSFTTRYRSG